VRVYGRWTSYTYMKQNKETSCKYFKWGGEGAVGRDNGGNVTNVQYKSNQNCHYSGVSHSTPPVPGRARMLRKDRS
jgi:hypothetical protein